MRLFRVLSIAAATIACVGVLTQSVVQAETKIKDVALQTGGILNGVAVDRQGSPRAGVDVACVSKGKVVAKAKTDRHGKFAFANMRGGVYEFRSDLGGGAFRAWAAKTAPPSASQGVLLIDQQVVRGQNPDATNGVLRVLSNPWVIAGGVAAAVAIPLAMDDGDDDDAS